ncbi:MAG: hypothetical protein ACRYFK_08710 [Janthinobacterium lividum]
MNNELDDLFRQQLDGHATPPPADLWARLQAQAAAPATSNGAAADPLDAQFRAGLAGHATPPRRALWERLEDEHLRPRQRRRPVVAWGRLAVAASFLLLLLAGGAGLWLAQRSQPGGELAATGPQPAASAAGTAPRRAALAVAPAAAATAKNNLATLATRHGYQAAKQPLLAAALATHSAQPAAIEKKAFYFSPRATTAGGSSSSSPVASTGRPRRPATARRPALALPRTTPQPNADAGMLAGNRGRKTPSHQPVTPTETPAATLAAAAPPAPEVIEVDVRRGAGPSPSRLPVVVAAAPAASAEAEAPTRPHLRLGGLLRQAGHALRGEPVSLAEAASLPESITVQAHLGSRVVSKTIQL